MKRGISKVTTPVLMALLALLVIGSDGDLAAETSTTETNLEGNSTGWKNLVQESVGENDDNVEGRSLGLLKLKLKRTKSSYKAAKPKGHYGAPKAQYGAPKAQYGAPKAQYGAPKAQYGAPKAQYEPPKANYEAPANTSPSYSPPVQSSSSNSHSIFSAVAYRPPSYNPPSYSPPSYNPPSYSPPSYNPPSYSPPSYNTLASSFYSPQEHSTAEYSGALHDSDATYHAPASYEDSAYPPPAYIESTDDQQQDYSPEHNDDSYAPASGPEYSFPYHHAVFNYPETNEDSGEDFFSSNNDFPTFDEFLKQNTFNFPNFESETKSGI
ncbi:hypothetical protein OUZ56_019330 [Daphnia magna]|uniref:Uncharacterized protein n=1 Tax=Daphnia magna TaxID=35525 RepID=A0ABQ9ZC20_9CRUS|nr:hypothetical protein OUZ56_019330 [Daphnia magna]